jgi:hypothetical protein
MQVLQSYCEFKPVLDSFCIPSSLQSELSRSTSISYAKLCTYSSLLCRLTLICIIKV